MSDNITLVKIVETSNEPTRLVFIFVAIIIIIGILLATIKTSENTVNSKKPGIIQLFKNKKFRRYLGLTLVLFAVMVLFTESSSLREPLVALSAVMATVISIISLNESSKIKEESLIREKKENYRQHLEKLVDWTEETLKHLTIPARLSHDHRVIAKNLVECRNELIVQKAKSIIVFSKIQDIIVSTDSNIDLLKNAIPDLNINLDSYVDCLFSFDDRTSTPEDIDRLVHEAGLFTGELRKILDIISSIKL